MWGKLVKFRPNILNGLVRSDVPIGKVMRVSEAGYGVVIGAWV